MRTSLLASSCLLLAAGCISTGSSVDLTQMEVAIGAAATLGHSGTLAMNAMTATTDCTQVTQRCTTYPCTGAVTITLGPNCPLLPQSKRQARRSALGSMKRSCVSPA